MTNLLPDLTNKNILITGATGGIGEDVCLFLNQLGANLILSARNKDKLDALLSKLKNAHGILYDLECTHDEREERAESFVKEATTIANDQLDGLICISGMTCDKLSLKMSINHWDKIINVNLTAVFLLNRLVSRTMLKKKSGSIINITSIVGHTGNVGQANYAASKAGLTAMSKTFALEYATSNIRNNCIAPGFIKTQMTDKIPEKIMHSLLEKIPMKKCGMPSDISPMIAFLLSDYAKYITGQTFHINGGMYMG